MADTNRLTALSMVPDLAREVATQIEDGGTGGEVSWADISDVPAPLTAAAAAGTASIRAIGTTETTAAAGNHTHTFTSLPGTVSGAAGDNLQDILNDLASRIPAQEP